MCLHVIKGGESVAAMAATIFPTVKVRLGNQHLKRTEIPGIKGPEVVGNTVLEVGVT